MEESAVALVLSECLAAMEQDGEPAQVVDRYPAEASEIFPLLDVAVRLWTAPRSAPMRTEFLRELGQRLRDAEPSA